MNISDWIAFASVVLAGGAALFAYSSASSAERSAEEAAKQNQLALHQRRVDALQAFGNCFEEWYVSNDQRDPRLYRQLRSARRVIKLLFKPETYNEVDNFIKTIQEMISLEAGDKALQEMIERNPQSEEAKQLRTIKVNKWERHMDLYARLEPDYQRCSDLLEEEINYYKIMSEA